MEELIPKFLQLQERFKKKVVLKDVIKPTEIKLIAGVDQAFKNDEIISSIVVCEFKTLSIIERKTAVLQNKFPYIPGLLSFREGPAIVKCFKNLEVKPDVMLVDGNGILHPRGLGLATHLGIVLNVPTIGVAKSLLCGKIVDGKVYLDNKHVGYEVVTKKGCKPIYVSPGHMVSLETSLEIVKKCIRNHKLPEPLRLAHLEANSSKRELTLLYRLH